MATLEIHHAAGTDSSYPETMAMAIKMLKRTYGDDICTGEWDTYSNNGAERMLVWRNEEIANADQVGAKAVAEIIRR